MWQRFHLAHTPLLQKQSANAMTTSAARTILTPPTSVPLAGRGLGARHSAAVAEDIEANVILLAGAPLPVALVAVDTLFCSDALHAAVLAAVQSSQGEVLRDLILVASHTHNAPSLDPAKPGLGLVDDAFFSATVASIANAIIAALATLSVGPCHLERGEDQCLANVVRRRRTLRIMPRAPFAEISTQILPNRRVHTPHDLTLIVARDAIGTPIWALWRWTCHATAFPDSLTISPDFPGPVRAHIRKSLGVADLPIIYLPGFAGDVRADAGSGQTAWRKRATTPFARPFADASKENFDDLCRSACDAVDRALAKMAPSGTLSNAISVNRAAIAFDELMETPRTGSIGLIRVDAAPLHFLFMGAETCSPYEALLAPLLPAGALLSGYAGEVPLYLPVDSQVAEGGYEVDGFRHSFDLPGRYFPAIQAKICTAVAALGNKV